MLKIWMTKCITVYVKRIGKPRRAEIRDFEDPVFCLKCANTHGSGDPCEEAKKMVQPYMTLTIKRPILHIQWVKDPQ
jgi:hypothetical protein